MIIWSLTAIPILHKGGLRGQRTREGAEGDAAPLL